MKKFLSSVPLSILALCLTLPLAYGMKREREEEDQKAKGIKAVLSQQQPSEGLVPGFLDNLTSIPGAIDRELDFQSKEMKNILSEYLTKHSHSLTKFGMAQEVWGPVILWTLWMEPKSLSIVLGVSKAWNAVTKTLPVPLYPWMYDLTDDIVQQFPNLNYLDLSFNENLVDADITPLKNLTHLNLDSCSNITDKSIKFLTKLVSLNLTYNDKVSDNALERLTGLTHLDVSENKIITEAGIRHLTNLTSLSLNSNVNFTVNNIPQLTNLTTLYFHNTEIDNNQYNTDLNIYYNFGTSTSNIELKLNCFFKATKCFFLFLASYPHCYGSDIDDSYEQSVEKS